MKMNNNRFFLLAFLLSLFVETYAQSDFGVWTSLEVKKKIFPGFDAAFEGEFRTRDDSKTVDRWSASADLSYRLNQYLKIGGVYSYINFNHPKRKWEVGHRYSLYSTGSYEWKRLTISLRERYQHTYRVGVSSTSTRANPKDVLRSRLQFSYNISKSKLSPYASVELYHTLNDPEGNGLDKTRYTLGTEYKLNKRSAFDLFYRYQSQTDDDEDDGHVLGLGYSLKF